MAIARLLGLQCREVTVILDSLRAWRLGSLRTMELASDTQALVQTGMQQVAMWPQLGQPVPTQMMTLVLTLMYLLCPL